MSKDHWVWLPYPAHFVGGRHCQFRLTTHVGQHVVSTLGFYTPGAANRLEEIGSGRFYETLVLAAGPLDSGLYYTVGDLVGVDSCGYATREEALTGHTRLCEKWSRPPLAEKRVRNTKRGDSRISTSAGARSFVLTGVFEDGGPYRFIYASMSPNAVELLEDVQCGFTAWCKLQDE